MTHFHSLSHQIQGSGRENGRMIVWKDMYDPYLVQPTHCDPDAINHSYLNIFPKEVKAFVDSFFFKAIVTNQEVSSVDWE